MPEGKFIVLEGIDGCGKSTQIPAVTNWLFNKNKYNHLVITREPYKAREIREILREDTDPYSNAKRITELFVQDRKEHVSELILPALQKGIYVVSDRYKYSTVVYQSVQGIPIQDLVNMHEAMPIPDLILIFDVPSGVAKQRMSKEFRSEQKFESRQEFIEKLRTRYLELPKIFPEEKILVIDGTRSISEISKEVIDILEREL